MTQETILLTGGTGHIGYAVLLAALKKGYKVRAAVRSEAKAELIRSAEPTKPYLSQLEFTEVKDITQSGAFDNAVKGVDAILHIASPIPTEKITGDVEEELLKPAVHGTTSILYSALKEKSIRRVVITSSVVAVFGKDLSTPITADEIKEEQHGPFDNLFDAYGASKTNANVAVRRFIEEQKPHFTINSVFPGFVVGQNLLAKTKEEVINGSNGMAIGPILGQKNDAGFPNSVVHLDDVVHIHIAALDPNVKGNNNYGASWGYPDNYHWDDQLKYAKEYYPDAVKSGVLPLDGHTTDIPAAFDARATEKAFNFKFKPFSQAIKDYLPQYIEVAQK